MNPFALLIENNSTPVNELEFDPFLQHGIESPWGIGDHDLSSRILCADEKRWIASAIIRHGFKAKYFVKRFKLKPQTVYNCCKSFKQGGCVHGKPGRPRVVDDDSLREISYSCCFPFPIKHHVQKLLKSEQAMTKARAIMTNAIPISKPMSKSSMARYMKKFRYLPSTYDPDEQMQVPRAPSTTN